MMQPEEVRKIVEQAIEGLKKVSSKTKPGVNDETASPDTAPQDILQGFPTINPETITINPTSEFPN